MLIPETTLAALDAFAERGVFRSRTLREAAAELACVDCGRHLATQAAHTNTGKGMGIKASDACLMALCWPCHRRLDQGGAMTKDERRDYEQRMALRTLVRLIETGRLVPRLQGHE